MTQSESSDGESVAIGASDGAVRVVRIAEGSRAQVVAQEANPVRKIAFLPNGKSLVTGDAKGTVRIWNIPK